MTGAYRVEKWKEAYRPNPAMLRQILHTEGYIVYQWCDQPDTVYGPHKHTEDQSHWIISGVLKINVERVGAVLLEAGDRDFLPAQTYHRAEVVGDEPVLYLIGELQRKL